MNYTQSTVTSQIKQLETELGVQLFDRIGKKVYLTEIGQKILANSYNIIADSNKIKELTENTSVIDGKLRFGTLFSLYVPTLQPLIPYFHKQYPKAEIMLKLGVTKELSSLLNNNKVDFILTLDEKLAVENWVKLLEIYNPAIFICAPDHKFARCKDLNIDDVLQEEFILTRIGCNYRYMFDNVLKKIGRTVTPYLELDDMVSIIDFVHESKSISLLPRSTVTEAIKDGALATFTVKDVEIPMWTQLLHLKYKYLTPTMQIFIKLLKERLLGTIDSFPKEGNR